MSTEYSFITSGPALNREHKQADAWLPQSHLNFVKCLHIEGGLTEHYPTWQIGSNMLGAPPRRGAQGCDLVVTTVGDLSPKTYYHVSYNIYLIN